MTGHSIRFKNYRYTEWLEEDGKSVASVLTDLAADPGEQTNVKNDPTHMEGLVLAKERLQIRIKEAKRSDYLPLKDATPDLTLQVSPNHDQVKQKIEGCGG